MDLWREALAGAIPDRPTWTLRDYHSPNLIWLPERDGLERVGLIDFQDAVMGHPAYDVASLLQDARVDASAEFELRLLGLYARERRGRDPAFDVGAFATAYALLAAQRATKILGIFARLDRRDGKPGYLAHLPRIEGYLARNLAHPALRRAAGLARGTPAGPRRPRSRTLTTGSVDRMSEPSPAVSRAFVLAAGLGKRMRPVTATVPKPLVEVAGKALLDHALDRVAEAGIGTAVVNVHYLADLIEGHLARRTGGPDIAACPTSARRCWRRAGASARRCRSSATRPSWC